MKKIFLITIAIAAFACSRIENPANTPAAGKTLPVKLSLSIENEENTKGVHDPSGTISPADIIRNLWIIQYNGTSDNSKVLGEATYIENFAEFNGEVTLVETETPCAIYFIANTFEGKGEFPATQWNTLGELKNYRRTINQENDVLGCENSTSHHVMLNGHLIADKIGSSTGQIHASLKRNVAKLKINIQNNAPQSDNLKIQAMQICSVPSVSYYTTDVSDTYESFPAFTDFNKVNYAEIDWTPGAASMNIVSYVPINKRGTTESSNEKTKNKYAPDGSTYLIIFATQGEMDYPITYTFYLGENLVNNHNLNANKSYTYDIVINSKGDAVTDSRITDWGVVDFTDEIKYPLSNCYILNPMPSGKLMRNFRIPIKRAMEFWGDGINNIYEDHYNYSLRHNADWKCFIIASDFEINENNFKVVKANGKSKDDPYFEVSVAPGLKGNVIIGVGHTKDFQYHPSWSWHLWITDYDPLQCLEFGDGTPGKYIYPVQNGSVHRYEGSSFWAKNKNVYIMDRNLGSLNSDTYPSSKQGLVYYQFGRKDPFFHSTSVYKYKDLNARYTAINYDVANNSTNAIKGMAYTVINPLHFINGKQVNNSGFESWIHDDTYAPAAWHDPHAASLGRKSIFDPCPPGYKVPENNNVWQDLTYQGKKNKDTGEITYKNNKEITTNIFEASDNVTIKDELKRGFKPFMTVKGMQYWPAGDGSNIPQQVIFYPSSGFLNQTSGNINYDGHSSSSEYWGYAWTTESNTKGYGASLVIQPDMISKAMSNRKSRGLPVRCITDRK